MTTFLGYPIVGSLSVPLTVGVVTVVLLWTFLTFMKGVPSAVLVGNELQETSAGTKSLAGIVRNKAKDHKVKILGSNGGCCSGGSPKSGACSPNKRAIRTARVFFDKESKLCEDSATVLMTLLIESGITTAIIPFMGSEITDFYKHADGSLCIFLIDNSTLDENQNWVIKSLNQLTQVERPLNCMKYSVFSFYDFPLDISKIEVADQLLHKSGAVRVCKADSTNKASRQANFYFKEWAAELCDQVQKWNIPKSKACKCGPKKKDQSDDSCGDGKCSDSDGEDKKSGNTKAQVLDLEDIAKLL